MESITINDTLKMVRVKKVSQGELPKLIEISYQNDQDLFDKFHIVPMGFNASVQTTFLMITQMASSAKCTYYKVIYQNKPIGYFVTTGNMLYSFGIGTQFRKKEILNGWWQTVKQALGREFLCMLYKNNVRAIKFLHKMGMTTFEERDNTITLLNK